MTRQDELCAGGTLRAAVWTAADGIIEFHTQPVDSYVRQYVELGAATWGDQRVSNVTDTTGTDRGLERARDSNQVFKWGGSAGVTDYGIQIGSDGTSESVTDNSLGTQLTTDISYGSTVVGGGSVSGSSAFSDTTRTFTNNTGSAVDINEAGITAAHTTQGASRQHFLCLRDTGNPIVSVADGSNVTVEYELEFQV